MQPEDGSFPWTTDKTHGGAAKTVSSDAGAATTADVGFSPRYNWTLPLVAEWIKREFGITMSVRGISAMLKRVSFHPNHRNDAP